MAWEPHLDATRRLQKASTSAQAHKQKRNPLRTYDVAHLAVSGLADIDPDLSARHTLNNHQKISLILLISIGILCIALFPITTLIIANTFATLYFLSAIAFRGLLFGISLNEEKKPLQSQDEDEDEDEPELADLPIITILLPLYHEASSLILLAQSIARLDYPKEKMDIKLLLEADDHETQAEALRLGLDQHWEMITVRAGHPQTKPKACNFGLYTAYGSLIVIYDAEDQPDANQLKQAATAFHHAKKKGDKKLACVQARLNFYNTDENWLTRFFALEYALWFDTLLPALEKLKVPIPLGGTSNFFRTDILREIGGWDPFNVTEDADLGLRLAARGYDTRIIESTTYEEANCDVHNWLRQRSRWMKGYMQTWLVHMRKPVTFIRATGLKGFIATQLFVGGNVFSALINPLLWMLFLAWHLFSAPFVSQLFPGPLLALNLFAFIFGNFFFMYLSLVAPLRRGWARLCPHAIFVPLYWSLTALAAYRGLWQLIWRPHYWEKTHHMLSAQSQQQRQKAMRTPIDLQG